MLILIADTDEEKQHQQMPMQAGMPTSTPPHLEVKLPAGVHHP